MYNGRQWACFGPDFMYTVEEQYPMDAQTLLLESLDSRWGNYREQLKTCRREFSEEAVHDLRVAARRLLALAGLIRAVAPHPRLQKIRTVLKEQLDGFDDLRDTQVMLAEISETLDTLPELKPFQQYLQKRERRLLREAEELIEALKLGGLAKRLERVRADIAEQGPSVDLNGRILQAVDEAYLTVTQRYGWLNPAQPATIHRVRVAFKKFRYTLEIIYPLLDAYPEANLKRMHDYQTTMGDIQDVEVFLRTLADFTEREDTYDPEPVHHYYEQRHTELIAVYVEEKGELFTFWRPQPDQPFPWEAKDEPVHRPARHRRRTRDATRQSAPAH
jgi:CHAD domain-containing protein